MNVFFQELIMLRRSMIGWMLAFMAVAVLYMSVYPAFSRDVETIRGLFERLPDMMKSAMGIGAMDMFSFLGFLGNVFPFITLLGAVQAMSYGVGMVSKETAAKTTDFLLTKPVSRTKVFLSKFSASLLVLLLTEVALVVTILIATIFNGAGEFSLKRFAMIVGVLGFVQLWFFGVGLLVSRIIKKIRSTTPLALSFAFGFFILGLLGSIIGDEEVRLLTPFKYISYQKIVQEGHYDLGYVVLALAVFVVTTMTAYLMYKKRDVPAAV